MGGYTEIPAHEISPLQTAQKSLERTDYPLRRAVGADPQRAFHPGTPSSGPVWPSLGSHRRAKMRGQSAVGSWPGSCIRSARGRSVSSRITVQSERAVGRTSSMLAVCFTLRPVFYMLLTASKQATLPEIKTRDGSYSQVTRGKHVYPGTASHVIRHQKPFTARFAWHFTFWFPFALVPPLS